MCGRFVSPEEATIERYWHLGRRNTPSPFARRFNVFPTDTIPFLRLPSSSDELELAAGRWGLVPHWWKEAKPPKTTFNARLEEAAGKPMWRDAWARSRCLIPAEGWYEWQALERVDPATGEIRKAKEPHFISRKDGGLVCFAGLASWWKNPQTGEALRSCAIVTAAAAGPLAEIHDPAKVDAIAAARVPPEAFTHWKVRLLVNDTHLDGPELIEPAEEPARKN